MAKANGTDLGRLIYQASGLAATVATIPWHLHYFFRPEVGAEYGLGLMDKVRLMWRLYQNGQRMVSATSWPEQMYLASALLSLPRSVPGDVIECGTYKGSSAACLSLICKLVGRKLLVCDSFQGLPEVHPEDQVHVSQHWRFYEKYQRGDYTGPLEEVQQNIGRFGCLECCEFVPGYFVDSLPRLNPEQRFALVFLDVDLHDSLRTCLTELWPRLADNGYLYTHEAQQLDFAAQFFDRPWWQETLGCAAPGLIGAGSGLPTLLAQGSALGYTTKRGGDYRVDADPGFRYARFSQ